jgi:hypothetical protein
MQVVDGLVTLLIGSGEGDRVELRNGEVLEVVAEQDEEWTVRVPFRDSEVSVPAARLRPWHPHD